MFAAYFNVLPVYSISPFIYLISFILFIDWLHVYCFGQDMLEGSQGQYIQLEKKLKVDFGALEKKYHKAKKLIKEYQQR